MKLKLVSFLFLIMLGVVPFSVFAEESAPAGKDSSFSTEVAKFESARKQWETEFAEREKTLREEQAKVGEVKAQRTAEIQKFEKDKESWLAEQDAEVARQVDKLFEEKQKLFEKEKKEFEKAKAAITVPSQPPAPSAPASTVAPDIQKLQKEMNQERAKFDELRAGWRANIKNVIEQSAAKDAKIAELEGRLAALSATASKARKEPVQGAEVKAVSEKQKEEGTQEKQILERTLEDLKKKNSELLTQIEGLNQKAREQEGQLETLNRQKAEWADERASMLRQNLEAMPSANFAKEEEALKQEKARLNEARLAYEKWVQEQTSIIEKQKAELKTQSAELETGKRVLQEKESDFDKRVMTFRVKSDASGMNAEEFQKKMLEVREENDRLKSEMKKGQEDRESLVKEMLIQKEEMARLNTELQKKERALEEKAKKGAPEATQSEKKAVETKSETGSEDFEKKRDVMKKLVAQKLADLEYEKEMLEKERATFRKEKQEFEALKNQKSELPKTAAPVQAETIVRKSPPQVLVPDKN